MFDYTLTHWASFLSATVLLNLSPGPDIAFILAQTAKNGRRSGFAAMFGIWTGAFVHVLFAALGLSAILATSATAFIAVKWIGAIYLVWLGIQAWRSSGRSFTADSNIKPDNSHNIFHQGVLVSTLNPKVAIFFLAFLPQFVVPGSGPASAQLFLHGSLIIIVAGLIEPPLVMVGAGLSQRLKHSPRIATWMGRGLGTLFISLGLRLASSDRS